MVQPLISSTARPPFRPADPPPWSLRRAAVPTTGRAVPSQVPLDGDQLCRAAHELKAPASAMLGLAELLATDPGAPLSAQQTGQLKHLMSAGRLLVSLIDELQDLTRLQSGRLPMQLEALDLNSLAREAVAGFAVSARQQGLPLSLHGAASPSTPAWGDRRRCLQVLMNLLSNAIKFNRPGGTVEVTVGPGPCIAVADGGAGLDDRQMAQLFQPFNRLGREADGIEGSGIGLALSRELMSAMGGTLMVSSTPGVGTTATMTLATPEGDVRAVEGAAGAPARHALVPDSAVAARRASAGHAADACLLCIDDNPVSALRLQEHLSQRDGPHVRLAANARDGLALAQAERPLAVLLNLSLPDLPGLEVLQQLRSDPATRDVPVAIVTGSVNADELRRARGLGAQACWTKPLDLARVDALLADLLAGATPG